MSKVSKPFIDRFSITTFVHRQLRSESTNIFYGYVSSGVLVNYKSNLKKGKGIDNYMGFDYEHTAQFISRSNPSKVATFQIQPQNKSEKSENNFFRIDFNPSGFSTEEIDTLLKLCQDITLCQNHRTLFERSNLTRLDIAVDIYDVTLDQYLVRGKGFRNSKFEWDPITGIALTHIIGIARRRGIFYDKWIESMMKNKILPQRVVRFEVMIRPYIPLIHILSLSSPFTGFEFYENKIDPDELDDIFMNTLIGQGLTLAYTGARKRGKWYMLNHLKKHRVDLLHIDGRWNRELLLGMLKFLHIPKRFR